MTELWLGVPKRDAKIVFLLPTPPLLPESDEGDLYGSVSSLIELNGNHWRKIFTIMAKLVVADSKPWREFRDHDLLNRVGIVFSTEQLEGYCGQLFIVGNTFRQILPIPDNAITVGVKQTAAISAMKIWCPYLDYRQFPNVLIENIRTVLLEKQCLKP